MKITLLAAASGLALSVAAPASAADVQDAAAAAAAPASISAERRALALAAVDAYWPQGLSAFTTDYFLNSFAEELLTTPIGELVEKYGVIEMAGDVAAMIEQIEAMEAEARAAECGEECEEKEEAPKGLDVSPEQALKGMVAMFEDQRLIDILSANDPHLEERIEIVRAVVGEEMPKYAAAAEPKMREHFATLFARRFTDQELRDLAAFASTPTGQKYARQQWVMWTDPAYFRALFAGAPESLAMGKAMMEKLEARMAHLPPMFPKPEAGEDEDSAEEASDELEAAAETSAEELIEQAEMLEAEAAEMLEQAAALRAEAAAM